MFQTKVVGKIKTHILCSITFFRKSCRLWDNVEKYGRARQATDDNIIRRMRFACRITKATDTQYVAAYLLLFHGNNVMRTRLGITLYVLCLSRWIPFESSFTIFQIKFLIAVLFFEHSSRVRRDAVSTDNYQRFEVAWCLHLQGKIVQEGS
jgi:hypothetical protein